MIFAFLVHLKISALTLTLEEASLTGITSDVLFLIIDCLDSDSLQSLAVCSTRMRAEVVTARATYVVRSESDSVVPLEALCRAQRLIIKSWSFFDDDTMANLSNSQNIALGRIAFSDMKFDGFRRFELPVSVELQYHRSDFDVRRVVNGNKASCSVVPLKYSENVIVQFNTNRFLPVLITNCERTMSRWVNEHSPMAKAPERERVVVGFDAEFAHVGGSQVIAVCQLCIGDKCLIIDLTRCPKLPPVLKKMMTVDSDRYLFVGNGVKADLVHLKKWARDGTPATPSKLAIVDFAVALKQLEETEDAPYNAPFTGYSLQDLAKSVLKTIIKPSRGASRWCDKPLSKEQTVYAALDAWAGKELWEAFSKIKDQRSFVTEITI